jgi:hypothetical protein
VTARRSPTRPLRLALNLALAALVAAGAVRAARALAQLPGAAAAGLAAVPRGEPRNLPLAGVAVRDAASGRPVDLAGIRRGALLVYDPDCVPCGANQWNWAEMARDLPPGVTLLALTLRGRADADYWAALPRVRVAEADSATMRDVLRAPSTPTTLLVTDGAVRRAYRGPLTAAMRADLDARLRR